MGPGAPLMEKGATGNGNAFVIFCSLKMFSFVESILTLSNQKVNPRKP